MGRIKIASIELDLQYTMYANDKISKEIGDISHLGDILEAAGDEASDKIIAMAAIMATAGEKRGRAASRLSGKEYDGPPGIDAETLKELIHVKELATLGRGIREAMAAGNESSIEVEPRKNADAAP